jgi:hypothetical protein
LKQLFGVHGIQITSPEGLVGEFNNHLIQCCLLFADEAFFPGDKRVVARLKATISEPTLTIQPKGVDRFEAENCLHIVMASNEDWMVPASSKARRFMISKVSEKYVGNFEYFKKLANQMEGGGLAAMLYDLLNMDLKGWHPRLDIPQTEALKRQKILSIKGVNRVIMDLCEGGRLPCVTNKYANRALTSGYESMSGFWNSIISGPYNLKYDTPKGLMEEFEKWGCKKVTGGGKHFIEFPPLQELRRKFDEEYGKQVWSDLEDWAGRGDVFMTEEME